MAKSGRERKNMMMILIKQRQGMGATGSKRDTLAALFLVEIPNKRINNGPYMNLEFW